VSDLAYKYGLADELCTVQKQKFLEKEPRPSWRETPYTLAEYEAWLRREVDELLAAPATEVMREAADVANLAAIYADVKRRGGR
jgi:hypothetical protein